MSLVYCELLMSNEFCTNYGHQFHKLNTLSDGTNTQKDLRLKIRQRNIFHTEFELNFFSNASFNFHNLSVD